MGSEMCIRDRASQADEEAVQQVEGEVPQHKAGDVGGEGIPHPPCPGALPEQEGIGRGLRTPDDQLLEDDGEKVVEKVPARL